MYPKWKHQGVHVPPNIYMSGHAEAGVQRQAQSSLLAEHFSLGRAAAGHQRQSHLVVPI